MRASLRQFLGSDLYRGLPGSDSKLVALLLIELADSGAESVPTNITALAAQCEVSRHRVRRVIAELERAREIAVEHGYGYRLTVSRPEPS